MAEQDAPARGREPLSTALSAQYLDAQYRQWQQDPASLDGRWQAFFEGFEIGAAAPVADPECAARQSRVASLIYAYRSRGHLLAQVDPLGHNLQSHPELELASFELGEADLDTQFDAGHLHGLQRATLREIVALLRDIYCRAIGVEYIHIQERRIRRWLQAQMEPVRNQPHYGAAQQREMLARLIDAELFETFLNSRYRGQKRFSLEGAESLIAAIHAIVEQAPEVGVQEIVLGMSHRGRLNVLCNILDKSYAELFTEFEDSILPDSPGGDSDVKYHKGFGADHVNQQGHGVHLTLAANPSHLEAVDPVVQGKARAKQRQHNDSEHRRSVLPLLVHGDAAFAGQGIVAETLNLSQLRGYHAGGSVHIVVNNQIGFTTLPQDARSSAYATDVAKMVEAPIFHVNGDDPEAVVFCSELALRFRQEFGRDVVIDLVCYRRHGHNEGDEPAFTQPVLYQEIQARPSVRRLYTDRLVAAGVLDAAQAQALADQFKQRLQALADSVRQAAPLRTVQAYSGLWSGFDAPFSHSPVVTAVEPALLHAVVRGLCTVPDGFKLNSKVLRQLKERLAAVETAGAIDWGFAELLAFGTLLCEGTPVRLSGQDSERGTFSQRHAVWRDMQTQQPHLPLNSLRADQAHFCVYNSSLSEGAVLGFDYGYSLAEPRMLILWEAQFGDFANGAQVIIDQFIVPALAKWQRASGLVMLLPHGYEGQGPEHSNAYLERYLQACADDNIQVCNLTTPGQYFHALRRQLKRPFRRPLVVMTPKSLLRHKQAVSPIAELSGGRFDEVLADPTPPTAARRIVLCSGKLFYDLDDGRRQGARGDVALLRIEQLYPLHDQRLRDVVGHYPAGAELIWAQEEPQNRGGWTFMSRQLERLFPGRPLRYVGRRPSASPATGSLRVHQQEQAAIVLQAILE